LNLVQLKETAHRKVFNLDLEELRVSEGLSRPAAFRDFAPGDLNAASPCLVLTLGPGSRPVPDDLRGRDGS